MTALWEVLNTRAEWLFLLGIAAVVLWNALQLRRDRVLALRLRAERQSPLEPQTTPKVSVLVAAWNEAAMIHDHIASFLRLKYPNKELILCAGGEDGTCEIARQAAGEEVMVLEQQPGEGKQTALQRCLRSADGAIIFLTDADCLLDDDSLQRTLAPLLTEGEEVASGVSRPLPGQCSNPFVVYQWCTDLYVQGRPGMWIRGILGRNCALTRQALERIGGFAATVRTGTDYYAAKLLLRQGYRIRYVRESAIATRYPETFRSYWRRQSRWLRNLLLHAPAFGAHGDAQGPLRTTLVGWVMLLLPVASLAVGPVALALWGVLFGQGLLAKFRYAYFARLYRGVEIRVAQYLRTPLYMLVDFTAWCLPLVDLFARRHRW